MKLCRDCRIVGGTGVREADVNVAYTAEVRRKDRKGIQRMTYNDFLTSLMKLSTKVYPKAPSVDDAFQQLLMEHVLPLASRRVPDNIEVFLNNEEVQAMYEYYADALEQIFQFYASTAAKKAGKRVKSRPTTGGRKKLNTMKGALGYAEFLKLASDFELSSSVLLSTLEIGDIYLSSVATSSPEDNVRKLTFDQFWESLVRSALLAYSKISDATVIDKIRGLFLYMWRAINKSVPERMERRDISTYAGDLLAGAMLFNKRFTAQWGADGYRDYLTPDTAMAETGANVLSRLLSRDKGSAGMGGDSGGRGSGGRFDEDSYLGVGSGGSGAGGRGGAGEGRSGRGGRGGRGKMRADLDVGDMRSDAY